MSDAPASHKAVNRPRELRAPQAGGTVVSLKRGGHVVVFGNEKGGTGKTTAAMHLIVALMRLGRTVAAVDLDSRQRSLTRHVENRATWRERVHAELPVPRPFVVERARAASLDAAAEEEARAFDSVMAAAEAGFEFVVVDTPGSDTRLSRLAHARADTLVTPLNDSFVDFDLLARVDGEGYRIEGPSHYAEFVWDCRKRRLMDGKPALDWVVMRNRVSALDARNKRRIAAALDTLSRRIGFRVAPGFTERVIFRELFPVGLTILDLPQPRLDLSLSMSHVAARQEVRELVLTLALPGVDKGVAAV